MNIKKTFIISLIVICLILASSFILINKKKTKSVINNIVSEEVKKNQEQIEQLTDDNNYQIKPIRLIDETDHLWGEKTAPVQMIIYSDFEDPFCANFYGTLKQIKTEFGDKVVVAYRHYLLDSHQNALIASEISECASEQGKFWEMYNKLFANNKTGLMGIDQFNINVKELGLDKVKFAKCLETEQFKTKILKQMSEGKEAGITGVPALFINNKIYPGAYPFEDFTARDGKPEKGMKSIIGEVLK
ncbi:MAG: thioredoxin domain-containing protein [Patescibacteria group bacterium]